MGDRVQNQELTLPVLQSLIQQSDVRAVCSFCGGVDSQECDICYGGPRFDGRKLGPVVAIVSGLGFDHFCIKQF